MWLQSMARTLAAVVCFTAIHGNVMAASEDIPSAWKQDAELSDVCFVDAEHGWAVGDRSVVWRTEDGGKVWHLVKSGVTCRLDTVSFADAEHGWIGGGDAMPYVHTSRDVVLTTTDGGQSWANELRTELPRIWKLQMRGDTGWAFGEACRMYGSGIFSTRDAGRTWSAAVPEVALPAWTAADGVRGEFAVAAAANGVYAAAPAGRARFTQGPQMPVSRPRKIKFADARDGWLVGDGGLLLRTRDGGRTWQDALDCIPDGAARHFDFHALEVRGQDIWLAGSPGTLVWHSTDAGETWTAQRTGQTTPLRAIAFVDRHRGWAVGSLGRILATRDGGHTWRVQLGSKQRASLVGFHATIADVPLPMYAQVSGNDGHLAQAFVMHEPYRSTGSESQDAQARRLHDAAVAVGACGAEAISRFPLPEDGALWSTDALIEAWNQTLGGGETDAIAQYETLVVKQIRTWRPEVVVTHDPADSTERDSLRALVASVVLGAVQKAGDPRAFPEQIAQAGLQPWRVKRVYGALAPGGNGPIEFPPTKVAPRLGLSLGEAVRAPQGQIDMTFKTPTTIAFRALVDQGTQAAARREFFAQGDQDKDEEARRDTDFAAPSSLTAVQHRLVALRNAQGILMQAGKNQQSTLGWLGQLDALAKGLDDGAVAEVVRQLADQYESQGNWEMAAEAHRVITQRYAVSPLNASSLLWLVAYESSGEIALRNRGNPGFAVRQASAEEPSDEESAEERSRNRELNVTSNRRVAPLLALVERTDSRFAAEPQIRFPLATIERRMIAASGKSDASTAFGRLADPRIGEDWLRAAAAERWLAARRGKSPLPVWPCGSVREKPYLDGKLDDSVWTHATVVPLAGSGAQGSEIRIVHDADFLYLAGTFPIAKERPANSTDTKRGRDSDLSNADHLELSIDVDRDYVTAFTLAVDASGRTSDRCGRDIAWNPEWFIATREEPQAWFVEAAIPLAEVSRNVPEAGVIWAIAARRHQPGVGILSATADAAAEISPAAFGWLEFK